MVQENAGGAALGNTAMTDPIASELLEAAVKYEVRQHPERLWVWQVWDVAHPATCNHFVIATFDSNGAADDFNEQHARLFAAALSPPAPAVEGWKLVPIELTEAMRSAWDNARPATAVETDEGWTAPYVDWFRAKYADMIAASPTPPETVTSNPMFAKNVRNGGDGSIATGPASRFDLASTPPETVTGAREAALGHLRSIPRFEVYLSLEEINEEENGEYVRWRDVEAALKSAPPVSPIEGAES